MADSRVTPCNCPLRLICEENALLTAALNAFRDLPAPVAIAATMAFRRGWEIHMQHDGKTQKTFSLPKMAKSAVANLGIRDDAGIYKEAFMRGFAARHVRG